MLKETRNSNSQKTNIQNNKTTKLTRTSEQFSVNLISVKSHPPRIKVPKKCFLIINFQALKINFLVFSKCNGGRGDFPDVFNHVELYDILEFARQYTECLAPHPQSMYGVITLNDENCVRRVINMVT